MIPTLGSYSTLDEVLEGVARQTVPQGTLEVVVVADRSDPNRSAITRLIENRPYDVRLLTGRIPGAASNRNVGVEAAMSPIVLFLDNDTVPGKDLVRHHLEWHDRWKAPEVAVLGRVRWARRLHRTTFMRWLDTGILFDFNSIDGIRAGWGHFVTANVSVKRSFFKQVGGFDEERFPYPYEDTDWAYRASHIGLQVLYNRKAVVDHLKPLDPETWARRAHLVAIAEYRFSQQYPELPAWFHRQFVTASEVQPAGRRGLRMAPYVPPWVPWLGPKVWASVDLAYKQQLAPSFLSAWEEMVKSQGPVRDVAHDDIRD